MNDKLQIIKSKVLARIDESLATDESMASYDIDIFLSDATAEILRLAPLHIVTVSDFSTSAVVTKRADGSGSVVTPTDFVRLVEFRMDGWHRSVTSPITPHSPLYTRQFNPVTRGGCSKPVVVLHSGYLEYFSLPPNTEKHTISTARYIKECNADELPDKLIDALCWLTASMMMSVRNEPQASQLARQRCNEIITGLYGDTQN